MCSENESVGNDRRAGAKRRTRKSNIGPRGKMKKVSIDVVSGFSTKPANDDSLSSAGGSPTTVTASTAKKRKLDAIPGFSASARAPEEDAMEGLDDEVADMLRRESGAFAR